ncbi:DUF3231 family protein [Halobacillus shinanisalinarum]|uniref:DUF3231 family protein n=1 Tax=Halobacillus shinanisalinarum TaxID=2932258 RepID=A0ABY4H317_9BACI|nr:DUF3231 family protein [Halobacillus shinanisalinarum]UOQ94840.1 DUF3231 family protein [Halobacillus shinanisalinarum]
MTENRTKLTSSELASIWSSYMNDSMSKCVLSYFLKHVEDDEIRSIVQFAYDISSTHIKKLTSIFQLEELPLPTGFTKEHDLNGNAPKLFTDMFMLHYINHMAKVGLLAYSSFMAMSARKDIRAYFMEGLQETSDLYDNSSDVLLSKGLFVRAPYIAYPTRTDFVDSKKYLNGYSVVGKQRPLNTVEISHLFMNIQTNMIGNKLALSFAQTSPNEQVQKWMLRGADISKKHVEIFMKALMNNNIQPPASSDVSITDSTTPPFSDKLALFHMGLLSGAGTGNYATAAAASQRNDLMVNYERLSLEIARFAKDGADLMISNGCLEQPPGTIDKHKLAKTKDPE